ncbi:MAG: type IV toxin-antitoxin system AbiEi family antitoxin domain-containing protein [Lapillicoccus sp.]
MELAQVGLSQGGLVTTAQCLAAGMTHHAVEWRVTSGRWQRLRRGVYLTHSGPADWVAGRVRPSSRRGPEPCCRTRPLRACSVSLVRTRRRST